MVETWMLLFPGINKRNVYYNYWMCQEIWLEIWMYLHIMWCESSLQRKSPRVDFGRIMKGFGLFVHSHRELFFSLFIEYRYKLN